MKSKPLSGMNFQSLLPNPDERAMLIGMTGSGKTTLAEYICAHRNRVIVYDTKGEIDWRGYQHVSSFQGLTEADHTHVHYIPTLKESLDKESVERFFHFCYERKNHTVYVDEVAFTCTDSGDLPFWLQGIVQRGRSRHVSFIGGTQRPKRIPLSLLSEANRWYVFKLRLREDALRIEQTFGVDADYVQKLKFRNFYYGTTEKVYHRPLTLKI